MMDAKPRGEIDLLLLCGARPTLIERTLASFSQKVFGNFLIANVFANIDPFQGGATEVSEVESNILRYFPQARIRKPEVSSFTEAVMWLWGEVKSPHCLHLEDDWVATHVITEEMILPHFISKVGQVSILCETKRWRLNEPYHCKIQRRRFLGINVGKKPLHDEPIFTTSPSFLEREFARGCSALMDPDLDPEKQLSDGRNEKLRSFALRFRNRLVGKGPPFWIHDIGREYRSKQGIEKNIVNGKSVWTQASQRIGNTKSEGENS